MLSILLSLALCSIPAQGPELTWNFTPFGGNAHPVAVVEDPLGGPPRLLGFTEGIRHSTQKNWHVYQFDPALGHFRILRSSQTYDENLAGLTATDLDGNGSTELVILERNGLLRVEDFYTGAFQFDRQLGIGPDTLKCVDLDGDQLLELVIGADNDIFIFDLSGTFLWSVTTAGYVDAPAVGQCDADPALEIVSRYAVVDSATRSIQWATNLTQTLDLIDADGDPALEVVGESSSNLFVWDVETQTTLTSAFNTDSDELRVLDIDGDGNVELIGVEAFPGALVEHDPATLAILWSQPLPEAQYGQFPVLAGDYDGDGDQELHFYYGIVYDAVAGVELWREPRFFGPYLGAELGDVDGDGRLELVTASFESADGRNGRILVFDEATRELEAVSDPVLNPPLSGAGRVYDLKLRDVDLDGTPEILVATAENSYPAVGVFSYSAGAFTRTWSHAPQPQGVGFARVEAGDVDGDGVVEILATTQDALNAPSHGNRLYVFDGSSGALEWASSPLHATSMTSTGLEYADFDRDGTLEVAVMVSEGDVHVFSGQGWAEEATIPGAFTSLSQYAVGSSRFLLTGDDGGTFEVWKSGSPQYQSLFSNSFTTHGIYFARVFDVAGFRTLWTIQQELFEVRFPTAVTPLWTANGVGKGSSRSMTVKSAQPFQFYLTSASGLHLFEL